MIERTLEQLLDLTDPSLNRIRNLGLEEARRRVASGSATKVREIEGCFALVAAEGETVRMARSLDRPMRYSLAKRRAAPALIVSDRIDSIRLHLEREGLAAQFHPSYT